MTVNIIIMIIISLSCMSRFYCSCDYHQLSSIIMNYHQLSSIIINYHQLSWIIINYHQLSSIIINSHQVSSSIIKYHQYHYPVPYTSLAHPCWDYINITTLLGDYITNIPVVIPQGTRMCPKASNHSTRLPAQRHDQWAARRLGARRRTAGRSEFHYGLLIIVLIVI